LVKINLLFVFVFVIHYVNMNMGRDTIKEYVEQTEKLSFMLMELIALSLGLEAKRFEEFFVKDQTSIIRLNYYPTCPSPHLALGVGPHKDVGALTVLAQDGVAGLEVKRKADGEWIRIKLIPNSFIINLGDIVQVLCFFTTPNNIISKTRNQFSHFS